MNTISQKNANSFSLVPLVVFIAILLVATILDVLPLWGGLIFFVILVLLTIAYPEKTLIALVVFTILVPVDLAIKSGDLPRIGPTRGFLAAFLVGLFMRNIIFKNYSLGSRRFPFFPYIAAFIFFSVISTFFSVSFLKSSYSIMSFIFEQFLLFYILVYFISFPNFWPRLKVALFYTTAIVCLFAFYEGLSHNNPLLFIYPQEELIFRGDILRVRSTLFHPIALGCYLTLVFPFVLSELIGNNSKAEKSVLSLLLIMMLITLFLTVSRGPWVACLIEIFIFLAWWSWRNLLRTTLVGSIVVSCSIILLFSVSAINKYDKSLSKIINPSDIKLQQVDEASSEFYRVALAQAVLERLEGARWIYGYGPGTFFLADVESTYAGHKHVLTAADSYYIKLLFEHGVLGLSLFIVLLFAVIWVGLRNAKKIGYPQNLIAIASLAGIASFIFENTTVSMFSFSLPLGLLFWMSVAVMTSTQVLNRE